MIAPGSLRAEPSACKEFRPAPFSDNNDNCCASRSSAASASRGGAKKLSRSSPNVNGTVDCGHSREHGADEGVGEVEADRDGTTGDGDADGVAGDWTGSAASIRDDSRGVTTTTTTVNVMVRQRKSTVNRCTGSSAQLERVEGRGGALGSEGDAAPDDAGIRTMLGSGLARRAYFFFLLSHVLGQIMQRPRGR